MTLHFNRTDNKRQRRANRAEMPKAEVLLWSKLKNRQLLGCKFRRQYSVESYLLDFYSAELKLAIELDGDSHFTTGAKTADERRQRWIESYGIQVLRFLNTDVYDNLDGVWDVINRAATARMDELGPKITSPRRNQRIRSAKPDTTGVEFTRD